MAPLGATFSRIDGTCSRCGAGRSFRASLGAVGDVLSLAGCPGPARSLALTPSLVAELADLSDRDDLFPDAGGLVVTEGACALRAAQLLDYVAVARPALARLAGVSRDPAGPGVDPAHDERQRALDALRSLLDDEARAAASGGPDHVAVVTETGYLRLVATRYDLSVAAAVETGGRPASGAPAMAAFLLRFLPAAQDRATGGIGADALRFGGGDRAVAAFNPRRLSEVVALAPDPAACVALVAPAVAASRARSGRARDEAGHRSMDVVVGRLRSRGASRPPRQPPTA